MRTGTVAEGYPFGATIQAMNAAELYEQLADPALRLERWSLRRRRSIGDVELRSMAWGLMESFDLLASLPAVSLEVHVREVPDDAEPDAAELEDTVPQFNTLLATLRRLRGHLVGPEGGELFRRALRTRMPDLSATYEKALAMALECLAEWEKVLIMYGAGDDSDADLIAGVVPDPSPGLSAGPSVSFEF